MHEAVDMVKKFAVDVAAILQSQASDIRGLLALFALSSKKSGDALPEPVH